MTGKKWPRKRPRTKVPKSKVVINEQEPYVQVSSGGTSVEIKPGILFVDSEPDTKYNRAHGPDLPWSGFFAIRLGEARVIAQAYSTYRRLTWHLNRAAKARGETPPFWYHCGHRRTPENTAIVGSLGTCKTCKMTKTRIQYRDKKPPRYQMGRWGLERRDATDTVPDSEAWVQTVESALTRPPVEEGRPRETTPDQVEGREAEGAGSLANPQPTLGPEGSRPQK